MDINDLKKLVLAFRDERDWKQFHRPKDLASAISIEAAELAELFLWKNEAEIEAFLETASGRERVQEELADVFAYLLCMSDALGITLEDALRSKLSKNAIKYPIDKAKGTARKYTEN